MSALVELRTVRFNLTKVAYEIAELNQKIKLNPQRQDMKSIRVSKITQLKAMEARRAELLTAMQSSPFSLADLADVIDSLAKIESKIVHGGAEEGHYAIRSYIDWLVKDAERLASQELTA